MTAVANNPEFAKKTGIPQSVGEKYVKADKKMKKYQEGGMMPERKPMSQEDIDRMMMEGESEYRSTLPMRDAKKRAEKMDKKTPKKEMEKPKMMMGGGMTNYKSGGKVRGAGCAKKGVRPCKMC